MVGEGNQIEGNEHGCEVFLAVAEIVLEVVALGLERVEALFSTLHSVGVAKARFAALERLDMLTWFDAGKIFRQHRVGGRLADEQEVPVGLVSGSPLTWQGGKPAVAARQRFDEILLVLGLCIAAAVFSRRSCSRKRATTRSSLRQ
jgi:hypothetical protein